MPELSALTLQELRQAFHKRLRENEPLAKYTSARIGGPADALITVNSADELAGTISQLWSLDLPTLILGGGSNLLVSDRGYRGVVVLNKAHKLTLNLESNPPIVWAESGANFGVIARQASQKGLSGLEWAAGIPGTLGGAIYGNAGAHGGEIAQNLELAEVLHPQKGRQNWTPDQFAFGYRTSVLKSQQQKAVVLSASLKLEQGDLTSIQKNLDEFLARRRRTQPPGASMGSMFKNPPGDYAGRLIEAAGLKGTRIGQAEISQKHANFFINHDGAKADEVYQLIQKAQAAVKEKFGVDLSLEIQLVGDWNNNNEH
jgi:UDP-N-acetylmuramate dehydrogenase